MSEVSHRSRNYKKRKKSYLLQNEIRLRNLPVIKEKESKGVSENIEIKESSLLHEAINYGKRIVN